MPFWYFDTLPNPISKSNVVTLMDFPVVVLKSNACFTVEFLNRFVHMRSNMACVLRKKLSLSLAHTDCRHFSSETILLASFVTRTWEGLRKEATILWNDNYKTPCGVY